MSSSVAKRWTRIASRSPYGIGCRTSATLRPGVEQDLPDRRLVWLLPQPVRVAQHGDDGLGRAQHRRLGPSSRKSAPAASTIEALCITVSCLRSE